MAAFLSEIPLVGNLSLAPIQEIENDNISYIWQLPAVIAKYANK